MTRVEFFKPVIVSFAGVLGSIAGATVYFQDLLQCNNQIAGVMFGIGV